MAWCPSTQTLLVWNLANGVDMYTIEVDKRPIRIGTCQLSLGRLLPVQVTFGRDGALVLSGSDRGSIHIWHASGQSFQVLRHTHGRSSIMIIVVSLLI